MTAPKPWPLTGAMASLDVDLLLRKGAIVGPYRRAHPVTLTLWRRIKRALRAILINRKGPAL